MNFPRILLAALGAFVAYMAVGTLAFGIGPLRKEFMNFPNVYRSQNDMKRVMPAGMIAMYVSMVVLAALYSMLGVHEPAIQLGLCFGALIGVFAVCAFVIHNHVNLNIGLRLTIGQSIAYFIEWLIVGVVIALIYGPPTL